MNTHRQVFLDNLVTARAALRRAAWINLDHMTTSIYRFVGREGDQLVPGSIRNTLGQRGVFDHADDIQVLKDDDAKALNQGATQLVRKVAATVGHPVVNLADRLPVVFTFGCSFRMPLHTALCACQVGLILTKEPWIGNLLASRKRGKVEQSQVNTNRRSCVCFESVFCQIARCDQVPVVTSARKRQRLDGILNWSVQPDADAANVLEIHAVAVDLAPISVLGEVHRVKSVTTFEPRVTWFVGSLLDTSKEVLERTLEATQRCLTAGEVCGRQVRIGLAVQLQPGGLLLVVDTAPFLLPGVFPFLEGTIVQMPVGIQHLQHCSGLLTRWQQTITKRSAHIGILTDLCDRNRHKERRKVNSPASRLPFPGEAGWNGYRRSPWPFIMVVHRRPVMPALFSLLNPRQQTRRLLLLLSAGIVSGGLLVALARLPIWGATVMTLGLSLYPAVQKWRADVVRWGAPLTVLGMLVALQGFHTVEHVAQWVQYHVLAWQPKDAGGLISPLNAEVVHFVWNWSIVISVGYLWRQHLRNIWIYPLFLWSLAHSLEHLYLFVQYIEYIRLLSYTGQSWSFAQGLPGILGSHGWLDTRGPDFAATAFLCRIVPLPLVAANRLDVHFWWNVPEFGFMLLFAHVAVRRRLRAERSGQHD